MQLSVLSLNKSGRNNTILIYPKLHKERQFFNLYQVMNAYKGSQRISLGIEIWWLWMHFMHDKLETARTYINQKLYCTRETKKKSTDVEDFRQDGRKDVNKNEIRCCSFLRGCAFCHHWASAWSLNQSHWQQVCNMKANLQQKKKEKIS